MSRDTHQPVSPLAEDFEVGDDSDLPGLDQPYAVDDIDAIMGDPSLTVSDRRNQLRRMQDDLKARSRMDQADEAGDLAGRVRDALRSLRDPSEDLGGPEGFGFDPDDRALSPDEILERSEMGEDDDANDTR